MDDGIGDSDSFAGQSNSPALSLEVAIVEQSPCLASGIAVWCVPYLAYSTECLVDCEKLDMIDAGIRHKVTAQIEGS
jgi:hypothetical protein